MSCGQKKRERGCGLRTPTSCTWVLITYLNKHYCGELFVKPKYLVLRYTNFVGKQRVGLITFQNCYWFSLKMNRQLTKHCQNLVSRNSGTRKE